MPLYDFRCDDGHRFERAVPLARFGDRQFCDCGAVAKRMICAPRVVADHIAPTRGPDGQMHNSLASYRAALGRAGMAEIGNTELPAFKAPEFDRKTRREHIRAGIEDVKAGRMPEVVTGDLP